MFVFIAWEQETLAQLCMNGNLSSLENSRHYIRNVAKICERAQDLMHSLTSITGSSPQCPATTGAPRPTKKRAIARMRFHTTINSSTTQLQTRTGRCEKLAPNVLYRRSRRNTHTHLELATGRPHATCS